MAKCWTILIYLAGDNNLELFGQRDLAELKAVGSTEAIQVVAQFDRLSDQITRRYYLTRDRSLAEDVVAELPEVNTGDPAALREFIIWGMQTYPAEHTALILWNHGSGWKEDDIYAVARQAGLAEPDLPRSLVRGLHQRRAGRSLFTTSLQKIFSYPAPVRAILFDDSSKDFLDNQELKTVLDAVLLDKNGKKLDLIGFDACLMNMIEVAAQVQHACHVMVGSQEIEPADGWPYQHILAALTAQPDMSAEDLGRVIVDVYAQHYTRSPTGEPLTLAALRLQHTLPLAEAISRVADRLIARLPDSGFYNRALLPTIRRVQKFRDQQYVDLKHLSLLLAEELTDETLRAAAGEVAERLNADAPESVVVAARVLGTGVQFAHGLSIYLPLLGVVSPAYAGLEFAQRCTWGAFLTVFVET
jgi:Clostripain family